MNYILGAGITALTLIDSKRFRNYNILAKVIGGQSKLPFSLGPQILHYTHKTKSFLESLGFTWNELIPNVYKISYIINGEIKSEIGASERQKYYNKTRSNNLPMSESCLSEGKKEIIGWDINELDLHNILIKKHKRKIQEIEVRKIDVHNRIINNKMCYDNLVSTMPLDDLINIINEKTMLSKEQLERGTIHYYYDTGLIIKNSDSKYFYNIDHPTIKRFTRMHNGTITEALEDLSPIGIIPEGVQYFKLNTEIKNELKLNKLYDIILIGRFAQYDHSVKLNNIIEEYWEG